MIFSDYRVEWEKIKAISEKRKEEEREKKACEKPDSSSLLTEIPEGRELADIYLRHPANESSSDSEGEEAPYKGEYRNLPVKGYVVVFFSLCKTL